MKKVFKFTETRSWYFELDVDDGAQVEEALAALVGTEGFNYYLTDRAEDGYKSEWDELSAGEKRTCCDHATEYFRKVADRELEGEARDMVLKSLRDSE